MQGGEVRAVARTDLEDGTAQSRYRAVPRCGEGSPAPGIR
jgi:hypothetical protein